MNFVTKTTESFPSSVFHVNVFDVSSDLTNNTVSWNTIKFGNNYNTAHFTCMKNGSSLIEVPEWRELHCNTLLMGFCR